MRRVSLRKLEDDGLWFMVCTTMSAEVRVSESSSEIGQLYRIYCFPCVVLTNPVQTQDLNSRDINRINETENEET